LFPRNLALDLIGGLWHGALRAARVFCDTNNDVAVPAAVPIPDLKNFSTQKETAFVTVSMSYLYWVEAEGCVRILIRMGEAQPAFFE
jgi:hypothetical protein